MERPDFWSELGLVAPPPILARIGGAVHDYAQTDQEVSHALKLASAKFLQDDYRAGSGAYEGGNEDGPLMEMHRDALDAEPLDLDEDEDATSCGPWYTSEGSAEGLPAMWRVLPSCIPAGGLPGVGTDTTQLIWLALITCGVAFEIYVAVERPDFSPFLPRRYTNGIMRKAEDVSACLDAVCIAASIPMLMGIRRLMISRIMHEAWSHEVEHSPGGVVQTFSKRVAWVALLVFLVFAGLLSWRFRPLEPAFQLVFAGELLAWLTFSLHQCIFLFTVMLNWRISWNVIERFRMQLSLDREVNDWTLVTRQYHDLDKCIDELWRYSNFGMAVVAFLASALINFLNCSFRGIISKDVAWIVVYFSWATLQAAIIVVSLYAMASISSRCKPRFRDRDSIFFMTMQHYGRVSPRQRLDHELFVRLILHNPAGVEVGPLGRITSGMAAIVFRILVVAIPSCVSFASTLSQ